MAQVDRALEIGVVEHDQRVLAAHFELHARLALDRAFGDARADALRAGEGNAVDVRMVDDRAARRRLRRCTRLNTPGGAPRLDQDLRPAHARSPASASPA